MSSLPLQANLGARTHLKSSHADRRASQRYRISGHVTALATNDWPSTPQKRICSVQLRDISHTGVGAFSREPLPVGARITLFLPPHGPEPGRDYCGTIVRCQPHHQRHDLGIQLDPACQPAVA